MKPNSFDIELNFFFLVVKNNYDIDWNMKIHYQKHQCFFETNFFFFNLNPIYIYTASVYAKRIDIKALIIYVISLRKRS